MAVKKKPLTKKEKQFRQELKKEMQAKGYMPPDKPKLNRKKYIDEAITEWNEKDEEYYGWDMYLYKSIPYILGLTDKHGTRRVHPEAIGVAKALKLAIRFKQFQDKLKKEGRTEYTLGEEYEFIKDILDA